MKLDTPINPNYAGTVVSVTAVTKLKSNKKFGKQACDNVVGVTFNGFQAIVGSETKVGDRGILFPTGTQLSELYLHVNNLYRDPTKNIDGTKKGYFESNGRIRAQKFRGHVSNALFMPLSSVSDYSVKAEDLKDGDVFDYLNGMPVCCKFVPFVNEPKLIQKAATRKSRVDLKHLPEHFTTPNYFKVGETIDNKENVIVTQKIHGTSVRIAHTYVEVKHGFLAKVASFFGVPVMRYKMDYVFGSRKVVKDANNPEQKHFYANDVWTQEGKQYIGVIPQNFVIYAEIAGKLSNGEPIQKGYTYGLNNAKVYVYRVVTINEQGYTVDLAWDQVKEFCEAHGMLTVPELWRGTMKDFNKKSNLKKFIDVALYKKFPQALPVEAGLVDEGVCVRVDRLTPVIMKAKSPIFYEYESKMLDEEAKDIEQQES